MDAKQAIISSMTQSDFIVDTYLTDLTKAELLARPVDGCNHIAWQLGHIIQSERYLVDKVAPGTMPPLPEDFVERHKKPNACSDDPSGFLSKDEYLRMRKEVRASALKALETLSLTDLDKPAGPGVPPFTKTVGDVFVFLGTHWLMHAGQWAVTRRKLGKPLLI